MAASLVTMLPVVVLFFLAQRLFIQGITLTGMKEGSSQLPLLHQTYPFSPPNLHISVVE